MPVGTFWSAYPDHSQVMLTDTVTIVLALSKGVPPGLPYVNVLGRFRKKI
jgi:hypothetical protein